MEGKGKGRGRAPTAFGTNRTPWSCYRPYLHARNPQIYLKRQPTETLTLTQRSRRWAKGHFFGYAGSVRQNYHKG